MVKALRSHKLYVPLITVAGAAGLFFVYYFFYVSSQRSYANDRAFRLLSVVGDQLVKRFENLNKVFAAALVSPKDAEDYLTERVPGLKDNISGIGVAAECRPIEKRAGELKLRLSEKPGSFSLWVEFRPASDKACSISGEVDLNADLRERFSNVTEEYFDDVLIASSSGEVLFQKNVSALRITNLNALLPPRAGETKQPKADETTTKSVNPPTSFQDASQFSNVIDVRLAGADYKLYVQPVPEAIQGPGGQNLKPIVCGLWRSDRLQSEVVSVSYSVLIWGTLLLLSVFALGWPLLKVAYMSPSERLRRPHVFSLLFSVLFAATLLTVIVLNCSYSLRANEESWEQLDALASRIDNNVTAELTRALAFMDALGKDEELHARLRRVTNSAWTGADFLKSEFSVSNAAHTYPYLDNVFWFDSEGMQQYKLTVQAKATPRTWVGNDAYYLDLMNQRLLTLRGAKFSFATLYSPNTGTYFAVLAKPYQTDWNDLPPLLQDLSGQALVTRPWSLIDPVVPAGFGYAVVDHDGLVQFHSSSARDKVEDFFKECRQDAALKSLVINGASDRLQVNYLGKLQKMVVRPMPYLAQPAASLIVFRDSNYFNTLNVACILVFALLSSLFCVPLLVALAFYTFWRRDYPLERLWPSAGKISKYVNVMAANACLAAAFAFRFPSMKMNETLAAVLALATAGVLFGFLTPEGATGKRLLPYKAAVLVAILVVARWDVALLWASVYIALSYPPVAEAIEAFARQKTNLGHVYLGMALSLLTVLVALPCFGLFRISYDTVNRLALESAQLARRDQLVHRAEVVRGYVQDLKPKEYKDTWIGESLDRYDVPVFDPMDGLKGQGKGPETDRDVSWLEPLIARASGWFPSNHLGAELRERATSQASNAEKEKWKVAKSGDDEMLWLEIPKEVAPDGRLLGVYPLWQLPWQAPVLMTLLAALLAVFLSFVIRKVFLLDLEDVPQLDAWAPADGARRNRLIIAHPMSGKSAQAASLPDVDTLDLAQVVTTGNWTLPAFERSTVVVDHFEFDLDNPNTCLLKLKLLEQLLYVRKKVVILLSAVDPMFYLAAGSPEIVSPTGADNEPPAQILGRWAAVLNLFDKLKMARAAEQSPGGSPAGPERPCPRELVEMVKSECDHTAQLRDIGRTMLERHCNKAPLSKAQFVEELLDRADSYYRKLWSNCTQQERLVLFQLAQDGWANPKNDCAIQQLQRRRIIRRTLGFHIMNESFRRFVRTAQTPDDVAKWEADEEHSAWSAMKLGLATAAMMLGAWLLYAQQDVFQLGIGYLAALGTASGAILGLARNLTGRGGGGKSGA
jgi:hypothetical protein